MTALQPLTVIYKDSHFGRCQRLPRSGGQNENSPAYFPATSIRGAIRHSIHNELISVAAKDNNPFKLDEHFMLAQGVDITGSLKNEKTDGVIDQQVNLRRENPAISLLGRWKLASKMSLGNAFPTSKDPIGIYGGGARTIMFERSPELIESLADSQIERLKTVLANQQAASIDKSDLKKQKKGLMDRLRVSEGSEKKQIQSEIQGLDDLVKTINTGGQGEGSGGIRRPIDGYEAFNKGVTFEHRGSLRNVTDIEIGIFIAGLRRFSKEPYLGGKKSINFGLVSFEWNVSQFPDEDALEPIKVGALSLSVDEGLQIDGSYLKHCLAEWDKQKLSLSENGIDLRKLV
ncbi:MAG: RAMP superfamily CRISPR-associated protein [Colwellia sp.]